MGVCRGTEQLEDGQAQQNGGEVIAPQSQGENPGVETDEGEYTRTDKEPIERDRSASEL